ncbi:uncharacterized protein LOC129611500 [Condylostylus longicornis]|uniref:uncharacterized protein LOC129611500 n=1 Tax=Condylostylus longicornis TaxID=2530218 RepID=UPI00244E5AC7|nr:uncharacterized protein LOC129611500 [Condylostylus longicornis]
MPIVYLLFRVNKIRTSDDVNSIISAEIPSQEQHPDLYTKVLIHNIHGPCGQLNPNSICMIDESCTKNFPKRFCSETDASNDGYPIYKRRNNSNERHFVRNNIKIGKRFVVPYNPFLTIKYNAHINVEICSTVKAMKYIHKYITKGQDSARIGIKVDSENNVQNVVEYDEIKQYLDCRYWVRRSEKSHHGEKAIGRIIAVSPKNVELYHLRLILLSVKGSEATSFEELKKFNGQTYSSYKEVARVRGLINDSGEWYNCMNDAVSYMMPKALRLLFVTIICHCNPTNPLQLFEEFKKHMIEDFIHEGNNNDQSIILYINYDENPDNIVVDNTIDILWNSLNSDQLLAADAIMKSVQNTNVQKCFYIDGPGSSDKTYLYRALIEKFNLIHKKTLIVAWIGIAAILLPRGMTCHSAFSLPLDLSTVKFPRLSQSKREILKSLDLLIWDEAPMAPGTALEIVDLVFQDLMDNKLPFGGKVLPVARKGSRGTVIESTIKKSILWQYFQTFKLEQNMRAVTDPDFSQWLLNVGNGIITKPYSAKTNFSIKVPNSFLSNNIVTDIFGTSFTCTDVQNISQRAILCPKNDYVRLINENVLALLQNSEKITFNAIESLKNNDGSENDNLQGQTFEKVEIYLEDPCFSHGQLYTGCSRAMNSSSLRIQIKNNTLQGETIDGVVTDNIVYEGIFYDCVL